MRVEDVAALLGCEVQAVVDLLGLAEAPLSLDAGSAGAGAEGSFGLAETVASQDPADDPTGVTQTHEIEKLLDRWISGLSVREREVLEGRYGLHDRDPETLEVPSVRLGITRERVRQIQNEALVKMRQQLTRTGVARVAFL